MYFERRLIFSKLRSGEWPDVLNIIRKIRREWTKNNKIIPQSDKLTRDNSQSPLPAVSPDRDLARGQQEKRFEAFLFQNEDQVHSFDLVRGSSLERILELKKQCDFEGEVFCQSSDPYQVFVSAEPVIEDGIVQIPLSFARDWGQQEYELYVKYGNFEQYVRILANFL